MELNPNGRLRTSVLLVILSRVIFTKGLSHNLHCVNDYVSTINCTLQSNLTTHPAMWLKLEKEEPKKKKKKKAPLLCHLSWNIDHFYCSVKYDAFVDTDVYKIFLCYKEESCGLLDEEYSPVQNIKPKPPCCLTLEQNSSLHHFFWKSTYEEDIDFIALPNELTYQLHFYQRGQFNGTRRDVNMAKTACTVQDYHFKPDSDYVAEVRSSPKQGFSKKGQWSDWSPKVHWRTLPRPENPNDFDRKKLFILVCVLVPIIFSLCFTSVKKWKQVYIPTPEPYFHTLYTDCHGDFKSWVIMDNTVDLPITEKTNHIEKIVECEEVHEVAPSLPQGSGYANMSGSECALPESGPPYAVSAPGCDSARVSCTSTCLSSQSRSPAEGDSGCWLSSDRSLEQNHLWYCNDYCTLSAFQQSALCTPSGSLKCGTCMIRRHDAIEETQCL